MIIYLKTPHYSLDILRLPDSDETVPTILQSVFPAILPENENLDQCPQYSTQNNHNYY